MRPTIMLADLACIAVGHVLERLKVAKLKANEKRVQLSFQRTEDVELYERLAKMAYDRRYDLPTFLLLALQEAFPLPDKGEEDRQESWGSLNNQRPAMDTDLFLSGHNSTAALKFVNEQFASHQQASPSPVELESSEHHPPGTEPDEK
jgi:hypothetical protein